MMPEPDPGHPRLPVGRRAALRRWVGWITLCYWGALFVSTHIPLPPIPVTEVGADKVAHVAAFAGLGFLTGLWLALGGRLTIARTLLLLAGLALYGALDEWLQQFVNRFTDFDDWVADTIGAAIGVAAIWFLQHVRPLEDADDPADPQ